MFGNLLKSLRQIYGLTATEISQKLGISNSYLSEIENNKKKPSIELLEQYAELFDIKLSMLIEMYENIKEENLEKSKLSSFTTKVMFKIMDVLKKNGVET